MRLSIALFLILIVSGCRSASAPPSVDVNRLADAYVSVLRLKAQLGADTALTSTRYEQRSADSLKARRYDKAEFQRQFAALSNSPDDIRKFSERVQALMPGR